MNGTKHPLRWTSQMSSASMGFEGNLNEEHTMRIPNYLIKLLDLVFVVYCLYILYRVASTTPHEDIIFVMIVLLVEGCAAFAVKYTLQAFVIWSARQLVEEPIDEQTNGKGD